MTAKQLAASLFGIVLILSAGARAESPQSASSAPLDRVRSFKFVYHADIPVSNRSAKKFEVWIPLPRESAFQQVRDLEIDTSVHSEIVDQGSNGNRVAHLEPLAPLPASVPVTMTRRGLRLAFRSARRRRATFPATTAGRSSTPAEFGFQSMRPKRPGIPIGTTTISAISTRRASHSRWAAI